ncbi:MAG: DUF1190 domain-containing protein [Rhodospirillales bacterium]
MKRSRHIRLMLVGGAGLISLTACDESPDPLKEAKMFVDKQQCESQFSPAECDSAYKDSRTAHAASAPRFASKAECEAEFGAANCEQVGQTSSSSSSSSTRTSSSSFRSSSPSTSSGDAATGTTTGTTASADGHLGSPGIGSMFIPAMVGYMVGRSMGGQGLMSQPVYRDTNNTAYSGNRSIGRLDNASMAPPSKVAGTAGAPSSSTLAKASSTASRGGFGATASRSSSSSSS